jgi:hypothetical protein
MFQTAELVDRCWVNADWKVQQRVWLLLINSIILSSFQTAELYLNDGELTDAESVLTEKSDIHFGLFSLNNWISSSFQTAELYLNDGELTDAESVLTEKSNTESELSSNYGKLKHSDSLLLLAQVRRIIEQRPHLTSTSDLVFRKAYCSATTSQWVIGGGWLCTNIAKINVVPT